MDLTAQNSAGKVTQSVKGRKCSGILSRLPSLVDFKTSTKIDALVSQTVAIVSYCTSLRLIVLWCHVFMHRFNEQNQIQLYLGIVKAGAI